PLFKLQVLYADFNSTPLAQTLRQLLRKKYRAMLPACAAERHHQIFEAALLISGDACIHQRKNAGEKLVHAFLLIEIVDHRSIFPRQFLKALLASGIGKAAAIENK